MDTMPAYFPSIIFFSSLINCNELVIYSNAKYNKTQKLNRCSVLSSQGTLLLSIPIDGGRDQSVCIKDLKISYKTNWILHHHKTLISCYSKAPWFDYFIDDIMLILNKRHTYLIDLNVSLLRYILKCLKLPMSIILQDAQTLKYPNALSNLELYKHKKHHQVFEDKIGFIANVSILDLLFNEGANAKNFL